MIPSLNEDRDNGKEVESIEMSIRHLYISPDHNFFGHHGREPGRSPNIEVPEIECLAGRGIRGDRFLDYREDYKGQITFFSLEVFRNVCNELKVVGLTPAAVRRNVIIYGADLNALIGRKFRVQGVEFEGICECKPCYWMDHALGPGAEQLLRGRGGLRARILSNGTLFRTSANQDSLEPGGTPEPGLKAGSEMGDSSFANFSKDPQKVRESKQFLYTRAQVDEL